jgi:hypothetical protein
MAIIFSQLPSFWITLFGWNFKTLNQKWAIGSAIRMARFNKYPEASARFPALQPKLRLNVGMRPEFRSSDSRSEGVHLWFRSKSLVDHQISKLCDGSHLSRYFFHHCSFRLRRSNPLGVQSHPHRRMRKHLSPTLLRNIEIPNWKNHLRLQNNTTRRINSLRIPVAKIVVELVRLNAIASRTHSCVIVQCGSSVLLTIFPLLRPGIIERKCAEFAVLHSSQNSSYMKSPRPR